jgi:arylsulfatase A-like enzyme
VGHDPTATPPGPSAAASESTAPTGSSGPRNVVVVLLDSLNRHMLGCYGGTEFATPHLDRFAATRATRFTNHVTGSLPCVPARHDILCGALDFLWKPWGSIELWERPITADLRGAGVTTMLVSDHPHLFETGGENYHTDFAAWDYVRGHEGDPWRTHTDTSWVGTPAPPARDGGWFWRSVLGDGLEVDRAYDRSRTFFRTEDDYPGPRTMAAAARWLRCSAPEHERFLLFVDEFDPHEPFDTPAPWLGRYEDEPWDSDLVIWPPYVVGGVSRGFISPEEARHIRANYGAKLSMIDHWFGEVLSALDDGELWDDTAVIVCTDHGHYLGDVRGGQDIWGKPGAPQYEPLGHVPLLVHWPGVAGGGTCDALTTSVDLHATLAEVFEVTPAHRTHGTSVRPLVERRATTIRPWALGGVWGNWVQVTDGRRKYARAPVAANAPLSMWSNRWSTMPLHVSGITALPPPDDRAVLDRMPGSTVPVIRQPFAAGDMLPFWAGSVRPGDHHLYDPSLDPDEAENRAGEVRVEGEMRELLRAALDEVEAPDDQLARLGLA